jgi:predicted dehydrogenase
MDGIGLGLVGLGRHGSRYAKHLLAGDVPGARLAAFWRLDPAKASTSSAELGVRSEPSIEALAAAPDVDAVLAVIPAGAHEAVARAAAAVGKPLLIEKPLARTTAEGARIVAAMKAAGAPLMVAQTLRFDPLVPALIARAAAFGSLAGFRFEQRLEPRGLAWEDDPELAGGGVLLQTGIHGIDLLRHLTRASRVEVRAASIGRLRAPAVLAAGQTRQNEDHAALILEVDTPLAGRGRIEGTLASSKFGRSRHVELALYHEDGALLADLVARTLTETRGLERRSVAVPESPTVRAALCAFTALVADRSAPNPVPGEEGLASLAVVEAAYRRALAPA